MQPTSIPSIERIVNAAQTNDSQELEELASEMLLLGAKHNTYTTLLSQVADLYHGLEGAFDEREVANPSSQASSALRDLGYRADSQNPLEGDRFWMAVHETVYNGPR